MRLIKLLNTPKGTFVYDAKTNMCIKIPSEIDIANIHEDTKIETLSALLKRNCSYKDELQLCPPLDYEGLQYLITHNCSQLVLSITEQCNMRCEYCGYHDRYDKENSYEEMLLNTAKKAIKMYLNQSIGLSEVIISFYGGEPLLRFSFIKKCVQYANAVSIGQHIKFHITTNGILLTHDVVSYLKEHDFVVSVSIDGPRELHDRYRKNIEGAGTYEIVINNLKNIYFSEPEYFCNNFMFMPVYAPPKNDIKLYDFFETSPINYILGSLYVTPYFRSVIDKLDVSLEVILSVDKKCRYNKFGQTYKNTLYKYQSIFKGHPQIEKAYPAGSCIPACKKIYVNAAGKIFLCEKVSESTENCIGDVDNGIDISKVYSQYTRMMEVYCKLDCKSCWAIHFCSVCFRDYDSAAKNRCINIRNRVENEMIASIEEWG